MCVLHTAGKHLVNLQMGQRLFSVSGAKAMAELRRRLGVLSVTDAGVSRQLFFSAFRIHLLVVQVNTTCMIFVAVMRKT